MKPLPFPRLTPQEYSRFFREIRKTKTCWLWMGFCRPDGYGHWTLWRHGQKRVLLVHRVAYQELTGQLSSQLVLDHQCRNKRCINPSHLREVTDRINLLSDPATQAHQNRIKTFCKRGHSLTGWNLYIYPKSQHRSCRRCTQAAKRKYNHRKSELLYQNTGQAV